MKKKTLIIVIAALVVVAFAWILTAKQVAAPQITTKTPAATSTQPKLAPTTSTPLSAHVKVTSPKKNETVGKIFTVEGEAPGPWYFEATFPVQVRNADGDLLANAPAQAQGEWMTDKLVAFKA